MKNVLLLLFLLGCATFGYSQIVISEIMFNPPESGNDSLEYIEFANLGGSDYSLDGHVINVGVVDTFTADDVIPAGGYFVTTIKAASYKFVFGNGVHQWKSGALNNSGETISLETINGDLICSATYSSGAGWPSEPNGNGASLELCDLTADPTDLKNWNASKNDLGIQINGKAVFATPGEANDTECRTSVAHATIRVVDFEFIPSEITINEGETVLWKFEQGHHNVNGQQATFPNNPASFRSGNPAQAPYEYSFTFDVPGSYDYQCDPHAGVMRGIVNVTPKNPVVSYPARSIRDVTEVNGDGIADSVGIKCELSGYVYGVNFRSSGILSTIIDDNRAGIGLFNASKNFGYTVQEGDLVTVRGTIDQFNGLTQLVLDTIWKNSDGNQLLPARTVTGLSEDTESDLIRLESLELKDAGTWKKGETFNAIFTDGTNDFTVRVVNTTTASQMDAPTGKVRITGLGGQFDNSSPFLDDYQIFPRYMEDITTEGSNNPIVEAQVRLYPNPVGSTLFIDTKLKIVKSDIFDLNYQLISSYAGHTRQLDLSQFVPGNYIIQVTTDQGVTFKKFVKI